MNRITLGVLVLAVLAAIGLSAGGWSFITNSKSIEGFSGPARPSGIKAEELVAIELADQVEGLEERRLRTRYWTIQPGGIVPIHSHVDRPATIYVVQGTMAEHRSDREEPVIHEAGGLSLEANVTHWWENIGDEVCILIATDIVHDAK